MINLGIFTGIGKAIDNFLNVYVVNVSTNLASGIAPLVAVGLTIWILMYGYAVMRQEVQDPINAFFGKVVKTSLILAIALGGSFYQSEVISGVYSLQNGLVSLVSPNSGIVSATGNNICELLDSLSDKGLDMGLFILMNGVSKLPFGGWLDLVAGLLVLAANTALMVLCGGYVLLAKMALAFILGVGPLFIVCLAFPPLAKFFDAWFGKALNYVLLTVILAFSIGLSMSIADSYLQNAMSSIADVADPVNQIKEAFSFVSLYAVLLLFVYQAPHIASGLAGGASLSGGGIAQTALGTMIGNSGKGNKNSTETKKGGGSVESAGGSSGNNGGSGNPSNEGGQSTPRVPAYRRASRGRYGSGK